MPRLVQAGGEGDHAPARDAPVGGLDAGDAAQGCRLADGAAGVGGGGGGAQSGGHRGGGASGGPAWDPAGVPGVLDGAVEAGLVGRAHGELVHVGLAQHHDPGGGEALDHGRVVGGDEVVEHARPAGRAYPIGAEDVLVGDGDAGERSALAPAKRGIRPFGRGQGRFGGDGNEAVQPWVQALDPCEEVAGQLQAGEVPAPQAGGQLGDGEVVHGVAMCSVASRGWVSGGTRPALHLPSFGRDGPRPKAIR